MTLHELTRSEASVEEYGDPNLVTIDWGESLAITVTINRSTLAVESVHLCHGTFEDITFELENMEASWGLRRAWYGWLASQGEAPTGTLDAEGLRIFSAAFDAQVPAWLEAAA